jgi:hypothetical protein
MKKIFHLSMILFLGSACNQPERRFEHKKEVVIGKRIEFRNGNTAYNFAFSDGNSIRTEYGVYMLFNVGDTCCFTRELIGDRHYDWKWVKCEDTLHVYNW